MQPSGGWENDLAPWVIADGAQLPESKDWYAEGFVSKPKEQGKCGACWAFAAASTLASLAAISGVETSSHLEDYSV